MNVTFSIHGPCSSGVGNKHVETKGSNSRCGTKAEVDRSWSRATLQPELTHKILLIG